VRLFECRDCADPIVFVSLDTGSRIPVQPRPNPAGNVAARPTAGRLYGYVVAAAKPLRPGYELRLPHAAVCRSRPRREPAATPQPAPEPDQPLF